MPEWPLVWASWLPLLAALYLCFEIWRGWRRGLVRHGISVVALLTAGGIGWIFAWMTGPISDWVIPLPLPAGRIIFGLIAGLAFYATAVLLASLLFKKTSQQGAGIVRLVYGFGGAFCGLIFGLLVLWGGVSMLRTMGAVAEAGQGTPADVQLMAMKASLEQGLTGQLVERVDIVPSDMYGLITKLIQVTRSPEVTARFLAYPQTQQLLQQPQIMSLFADPAVAKAAEEGDYFSLLTSPKLAEIAADPQIQESFASFPFEKALDYALQYPPPSPSPSP